jgi:hypothetical protein
MPVYVARDHAGTFAIAPCLARSGTDPMIHKLFQMMPDQNGVLVVRVKA